MSQPESRKRNKKRYGGHHAKKWRGPRELEVGMVGILITCNMNQRKCTAEAYDLLGEYAEKLYGPEKSQDGCSSEEDEDVEEALRKEVASLQAAGAKQQRRFQAMDSGANNVIFIRTHNMESDKLVHHILSDIYTTKKKKSRTILRMLPVTGTCRAYQDEILSFLTDYLAPWFSTPNRATYQIAFKARNSSHSKREEMIKNIAGLVGKLNPRNKVDLTDPELTIIIEVIKAVCCVSVVRDYRRYKKYNLQEIVKEDASNPEESEAKTGKSKPEEEVKEEKEEQVKEKHEEEEKGKEDNDKEEEKRDTGETEQENGKNVSQEEIDHREGE